MVAHDEPRASGPQTEVARFGALLRVAFSREYALLHVDTVVSSILMLQHGGNGSEANPLIRHELEWSGGTLWARTIFEGHQENFRRLVESSQRFTGIEHGPIFFSATGRASVRLSAVDLSCSGARSDMRCTKTAGPVRLH